MTSAGPLLNLSPSQQDAYIKKSIAKGKSEEYALKKSQSGMTQWQYVKLHHITQPPPPLQQVLLNNFLKTNKIPTSANVIGQIKELINDSQTIHYAPPVSSSNIACTTATHSTQCHTACHEMRHWSNIAGDRFSQGKNNAISDCVSNCNDYQKGCIMVAGNLDSFGYTFVIPKTPLGINYISQ